MAILTKEQILERVKVGEISFAPRLDKFQLQSASIDLRLGFTFLVPKLWQITKAGREALNLNYYQAERPQHFEIIELEQGQYFEILPQEYVLVSTLETMKLPGDLIGMLFPRSSVNRKGLSVDLSGIINPGYEGQLVIPLTNNTKGQTIRLYPGERFCQVVFSELAAKTATEPGKYHKKDIIAGVADGGSPEEDSLIQKGEIGKLKKDHPA